MMLFVEIQNMEDVQQKPKLQVLVHLNLQWWSLE